MDRDAGEIWSELAAAGAKGAQEERLREPNTRLPAGRWRSSGRQGAVSGRLTGWVLERSACGQGRARHYSQDPPVLLELMHDDARLLGVDVVYGFAIGEAPGTSQPEAPGIGEHAHLAKSTMP